ncbi:P27 family phage terminase small subunit [Streptomyces sp. SHP 1-2]|uniref:P27 family phage terminase small subunit n=1 Tax=Streptomyces sp. SHP 1-2 TaxID=2769489 RepID=UPI0022374235|nr:P27 family phage terminase small subunit [Streptomyces sp. SHP 1-2]
MRLEKALCVCVARIDQVERDLSERGLIVTAERGTVKNGASTIAGQYRTRLARYIRELGLLPSARTAIAPPEPDDNDSDVWDWFGKTPEPPCSSPTTGVAGTGACRRMGTASGGQAVLTLPRDRATLVQQDATG